MRITTNMMTMNMLKNINNNLNRMSDKQNQLATGKRISSAMDDPVGIAKVIKYKSDLSEIDQYDRNTDDALSWLEYTESAMVGLGESYKRLSELCVQGANGTYSEADRKIMKMEVKQIKEHIITTANSSFAGRYVFSNNKTNSRLMRNNGNYNFDITSYDISEGSKTLYQIGIGENIIINTNGLDLFGYKEEVNYLTEVFPDPDGMSAIMTGKIDPTHDYSSQDVSIKVGNKNYKVDSSKLKGNTGSFLEKILYDAKDKFGQTLKESGLVTINCDNDGVIKVVAKKNFDGSSPNISGKGAFIFDDATNPSSNYNSKAGINKKDMQNNINKGIAATPKGQLYDIKMSENYSTNTVTITVGGENFVVKKHIDKINLAGSDDDPIDKKKLIEALYNAEYVGTNPSYAGKTLAETNLVDIYYKEGADGKEKLAVLNKEHGAGGKNISISGVTINSSEVQVGKDAQAYKMSGAVVLDDAEIQRQKGKQDFVVTLDGKVEVLSVDMSACNNAADFTTALQKVLDEKFPNNKPIDGTSPQEYQTSIKVSLNGGKISFETLDSVGAPGTPNTRYTKVHDFDIRAIKTKKSTVMEDLDNLINAFENDNDEVIGKSINIFKKHTENMLNHRSDIGAKVNRMQLIVNRSSENKLSFTKLLSEVEDVDVAEAIMYLRSSENVYRASLQTGAKIIQPSLMDFLR